jgi:hypothetical protein
MLVFAPIAVLTAIVAGAVLYLATRGLFTNPASFRPLGVSLALYTAAVLVFIRLGLSSIDNLESLGLTDSLSGLPNRRAIHLDIVRLAEALTGDGKLLLGGGETVLEKGAYFRPSEERFALYEPLPAAARPTRANAA